MRSATMTMMAAAVAVCGMLAQVAHAQVKASEISSIDYGAMIGGPLIAVINAQAQSALTTVNFINSVGFDENRNAINVAFNYNSTNSTTGEVSERSLSVPILTILPIPFIRIEECTIEFNAKINSVTSSEMSNTMKVGVEASGSYNGLVASASFSASFSNEKTEKNSNTETREFSMRVFVRAVQDDMPAGMRKILDILEQAILNTVKEAAAE